MISHSQPLLYNHFADIILCLHSSCYVDMLCWIPTITPTSVHSTLKCITVDIPALVSGGKTDQIETH